MIGTFAWSKGIASTLASGILLYFGTGLNPIWYLTWLAPIPILLFASGAPAWAAFMVAILAFLLGSANTFFYAHGVIGLPLPVVVSALVIPSAAFGVAVLLWRFCLRRGSLWQAALGFPCAWVAYEFLNACTSPHGTFGSLSYSEMDCLPLLQVAALTGLWGVAFMLLLVSATGAILLLPRSGQRSRTALAAGVSVTLAAVLAFGEWRLHSDLHATGTLRVALISSDAEEDHWAKDDQHALAILRRYATQIESAHGAQVAVLPEDLGPVSPTAAATAAQIMSAAAKRSGTEVVVGLRAGLKPPMLNEALVFAPSGELEARYEKHHLIPRLEDGIVAGTWITTLPASTGVEGVQICKDLDFPGLSRDYGARKVGLLLVPAFDFDVDGWLHGRMAVMRGVESGFSVARAARHGLLTVTDNRGSVLLQRAGSSSGFVIATADVPVANAATLYGRFGDWFAVVCIALLLVAIGTATVPSSFRLLAGTRFVR
ncbi:MAG: nitrilase-related carbon-nitrogen hydrolase [Bryobacteraceae bacterium]